MSELRQTGYSNTDPVETFKPELSEFIAVGDMATLEHSIRVAKTGSEIARASGLTKDEAWVVEASGLLHDLGKVDPRIAPIINRTSALTPLQREVINLHAQLAFERMYKFDGRFIPLRQKVGSFVAPIALNALFSHYNAVDPDHQSPKPEYLDDLVRNNVLNKTDLDHPKTLGCQVLSLADMLDALLSKPQDRQYREARAAQSGRSVPSNPQELINEIENTITVPDLDIEKVVDLVFKIYPAKQLEAHEVSKKLSLALQN